MKKMPTLFTRIFENHRPISILNEVTQGCEWALTDESIATQKLDGTCCLIKNGKLYARYDYKEGRTLPEGAIPCQEQPDTTTGHFPHWVPVADQPQYKYYIKAFEAQKPLDDGTYELCGEHFQGNPENIKGDLLIKHGAIVLNDVPKTFEGIRDYLENNWIEGIVFYNRNGDMCKIKRSDFGFNWASKKSR